MYCVVSRLRTACTLKLIRVSAVEKVNANEIPSERDEKATAQMFLNLGLVKVAQVIE